MTDVELRTRTGEISIGNSIPHHFGPPGASQYRDHPNRREPSNPLKIFESMRSKELPPLLDVKVLKGTVYSFKNRRVITKWIRDVCAACNLRTTTFNLAVQLCDCYMLQNLNTVPVSQCQLVALGALWVAAKFEEMDSALPSLQNLVEVCDKAYTKEQILEVEETMLIFFKWKLPHTTATNFLYLYLHALTLPGKPVASSVPASDASAPVVTLRILKVDKLQNKSVVVEIPNIKPTVTLNKLSGAVRDALGISTHPTFDYFKLQGEGVVMAFPLPQSMMVQELCPASSSTTAVIYAHPTVLPSCVFAENEGRVLLRTPNHNFLRLAEALLREALIHVEFLRVSPHVMGLATLIVAACGVSPTGVDATASLAGVSKCISGQQLPHLRSAAQLMVDKYNEAVEALKVDPRANADPASQLFPLPAEMNSRLEAALNVMAPAK